MKTVKLLGELGKEFGKSFKLEVSSPAEAVRALCINFPAFKKHLIDSGERGVAYKVLVGKEALTCDDLHNPSGKDVIRIVPVLQGAGGGGVVQTIIGAALVALSFVPFLAPIAPYLMSAGIAMMIGGVVQMLSPTPNLSSQDSNNQPDNKPSYTFNGAVNTSAQGYPVPIGYGRMMVGSAVISGGITVEELA